jgi:hypothetical protein
LRGSEHKTESSYPVRLPRTIAETNDPIVLLAYAGTFSGDAADQAEVVLGECELAALPTAEPNGHVQDVVASARESGRIVVVSNCAARTVNRLHSARMRTPESRFVHACRTQFEVWRVTASGVHADDRFDVAGGPVAAVIDAPASRRSSTCPESSRTYEMIRARQLPRHGAYDGSVSITAGQFRRSLAAFGGLGFSAAGG